MAQQLRAPTTLAKDQVLFPAPTSGSSQPLVNPVIEEHPPLLHEHAPTHSCAQSYLNTYTKFKNKILKNKTLPIGRGNNMPVIPALWSWRQQDQVNIQGHPWLHSLCEVMLEYIGSCIFQVFSIFMYVCVSVVYVCGGRQLDYGCPWRPSGVTASCELTSVGARNPTQVLENSGNYS